MENRKCFNAIRKGNLGEVKKIIIPHGLLHPNFWQYGYALLCFSVKNKRKEISKYLISIGAKVNPINPTTNPTKNKRKHLGETPLHHAAKSGQIDIAQLLLDNGAYIDAKNQYGGTALQTAVFHQQLEMIEFLLQRGAAVNEIKNDGSIPLNTAIESGNLKVIEMLLKHHANANYMSMSNRSNGDTLLHKAVEMGQDKIVELLIKYNATIDVKNKSGVTPIWQAIVFGYEKIVQTLLEHGANVDTGHFAENRTILCLAVEKGNLKIVEHILKHNPDVENAMNKTSIIKAISGSTTNHKTILDKLLQYGFSYVVNNTVLLLAIERGNKDIVENCLQTQAKTLLAAPVTKQTSPLHLAIQRQRFDIVEMLLKYGADVNGTDENNKTPIFYATVHGDLEMIELLLANKASATMCEGLLSNAVLHGSEEMVNLLLSHKVNVREVANEGDGKTPLHFCGHNEAFSAWEVLFRIKANLEKPSSSQVKCEIAKKLIAAGADVNAKCNDGKSTLHYACLNSCDHLVKILFENGAKMFADCAGEMPMHLNAYNGNISIFNTLLSHGADVNAKNEEGSTPVHVAAHEGHLEYLECLLQNGANVDVRENDGATALHIAAKNDYNEIIELLLKYGAEIDAEDSRGWTALYIATKRGNHLIVKTLLDYGCDLQQKNTKQPAFTTFETDLLQGLNMFADFFNNYDSDDDDDYYDDYNDLDDDDSVFDDYNNYYLDSDDDFNDSDMDFLEHMDHRPCNLNGAAGPIFQSSGNSINEMLKQHYIMMEAANIPLKNDEPTDADPLQEDDNFVKTFKTKCEEEVAKLKCEKISPDTNVTFYDILAKPVDRVAVYMKNSNLDQVLRNYNFKNEFPFYSGLLNGKVVRAFNRKVLCEQGSVFFDLLMVNQGICLPYNCVENICSYLNDKDMRILGDATKPKTSV